MPLVRGPAAAATRSDRVPGSLHRCRQTWGRRARRAGNGGNKAEGRGNDLVTIGNPQRVSPCSPAVPLPHATRTCGRPAAILLLEGLGEATKGEHRSTTPERRVPARGPRSMAGPRGCAQRCGVFVGCKSPPGGDGASCTFCFTRSPHPKLLRRSSTEAWPVSQRLWLCQSLPPMFPVRSADRRDHNHEIVPIVSVAEGCVCA